MEVETKHVEGVDEDRDGEYSRKPDDFALGYFLEAFCGARKTVSCTRLEAHMRACCLQEDTLRDRDETEFKNHPASLFSNTLYSLPLRLEHTWVYVVLSNGGQWLSRPETPRPCSVRERP